MGVEGHGTGGVQRRTMPIRCEREGEICNSTNYELTSMRESHQTLWTNIQPLDTGPYRFIPIVTTFEVHVHT